MTETEIGELEAPRKPGALQRIVLLGITVGCFAYLYVRLNGAARREGLSLVDYMTQVFSNVEWIPWLLLMIVYSFLYFSIDTLVVTRALSWFIKEIRYRDILPIRASAYIISIFNEQIGKGAMAYYLNKRDQVPGWEVGSVMLFVMFCEVFYLLVWATIGFFISGDTLPEVFGLIPPIALGAAVVLTLWMLYFQGKILPNNQLRDKRLLHAFRLAKPKHYLWFLLLRSPALLAAVVVYTIALSLFGVETSFCLFVGLFARDFFRGRGAHAHARCGDHFLGHPVSLRTRDRWRRSGSYSIIFSFCSMRLSDFCFGDVHSGTYSVANG